MSGGNSRSALRPLRHKASEHPLQARRRQIRIQTGRLRHEFQPERAESGPLELARRRRFEVPRERNPKHQRAPSPARTTAQKGRYLFTRNISLWSCREDKDRAERDSVELSQGGIGGFLAEGQRHLQPPVPWLDSGNDQSWFFESAFGFWGAQPSSYG